MTKPDLTYLAPHVVSLAEEAGKLICTFYEEDKIANALKADGSPVTQADQQSHLLLKGGLGNLAPSIPVISEEDERSWALKSPYYWLIDPLDGTKGFISKAGNFCINIALMEGNHPLFGLIHIPLTHESYYGYEGKAWKYKNGNLTSIHTRTPLPQGMTLLLGGYGKKYKAQEEEFLKTYPIRHIKHIRSAIKFCLIASGQADLYLRFDPSGEWDTAAGQALVEAAGGRMTKLDGSPFLYGKPGLINEEFIVFGFKL